MFKVLYRTVRITRSNSEFMGECLRDYRQTKSTKGEIYEKDRCFRHARPSERPTTTSPESIRNPGVRHGESSAAPGTRGTSSTGNDRTTEQIAGRYDDTSRPLQEVALAGERSHFLSTPSFI